MLRTHHEDLEIDFPTPEGDVRLGDVKRYIILWQKKYIMFPGSAPRPPTPRNPSPPSPGERRPPTPPRQSTSCAALADAPQSTSGAALVDAASSPPQAPHQPTPPPSAPPTLKEMSPPSAPSATQAKPPPNTTQKGKRWSRAATVSTTDKVVHKTTKIPGPSLKPLP
jgi:hypothetical protein